MISISLITKAFFLALNFALIISAVIGAFGLVAFLITILLHLLEEKIFNRMIK